MPIIDKNSIFLLFILCSGIIKFARLFALLKPEMAVLTSCARGLFLYTVSDMIYIPHIERNILHYYDISSVLNPNLATNGPHLRAIEVLVFFGSTITSRFAEILISQGILHDFSY